MNLAKFRLRAQTSTAWDRLRASFGFLAGIGMVAGLIVGLLMPAVDELLGISVPVLSFDDQSSARSLLETIGTSTVAVAGLSISVTVVAFTLASSQLSPRVLRTFRADRFSQVTLALFLGTFIYCLTLLVRLGVSGSEVEPPNLSVTLAVLLALASFGTFAGFIGHIVSMLQPSSVVAAIHADASQTLATPYPSGPGEPKAPTTAESMAKRAHGDGVIREVKSERSGYLGRVDIGRLIGAARGPDALITQRIPIGSYVMPGEVIASLVAADADEIDQLNSIVRDCFDLNDQRTMVQDIGFPIRQLADIALKGLSPGINDPTTAENAMEMLASVLIEFARAERPCNIRVDGDGEPRLVALAPDFGDLVKAGFEQTRIFAQPYPVVSKRLLALLAHLEMIAGEENLSTAEIQRQRALIVAAGGDAGLTPEDVREVGAAAEAEVEDGQERPPR